MAAATNIEQGAAAVYRCIRKKRDFGTQLQNFSCAKERPKLSEKGDI